MGYLWDNSHIILGYFYLDILFLCEHISMGHFVLCEHMFMEYFMG